MIDNKKDFGTRSHPLSIETNIDICNDLSRNAREYGRTEQFKFVIVDGAYIRLKYKHNEPMVNLNVSILFNNTYIDIENIEFQTTTYERGYCIGEHEYRIRPVYYILEQAVNKNKELEIQQEQTQALKAHREAKRDMDFINKVAVEAMRSLMLKDYSPRDMEGFCKACYDYAKAMLAQSKIVQQEMLEPDSEPPTRQEMSGITDLHRGFKERENG